MEMEKVKRKFKMEDNKVYTLRKLRNVSLQEFQGIISKQLETKLTPSELKIVQQSNNLVLSSHCDGYKYTVTDFSLMREASRIFTSKIPLATRKNIEIFEKSHNIKTMWGDESAKNSRGQNFKLDSYE